MNRPRIYLSPPHMSEAGYEAEFVREAFASNWIAPLGPQVDAFEAEFAAWLGVPYAAALSSGTAAIHLALLNLGIGPGDEVLCSTFTFSASANPIVYVGARPVFVDSDLRTWNMDPNRLESELARLDRTGARPKAVIVVDLYGQSADYTAIGEVCRRFGVPIIEDAAEALGATLDRAKTGTFGLMGAFSFNGNKIITTSGGGMLVSSRKDLIDRARFLATQARDPAPHYQHSHIGFNYRLSNILAAVGRGQLKVLDDRIRKRRWVFEYYRRRLSDLPGLSFMPEPEGFFSTRWLTCVLIDPDRFGATRDDVRLKLEQFNIESRPLWKPMHLQPVFQGCRVVGGNVSEHLFEQGLCLPSGSSLDESTLDLVCDLVKSVSRP